MAKWVELELGFREDERLRKLRACEAARRMGEWDSMEEEMQMGYCDRCPLQASDAPGGGCLVTVDLDADDDMRMLSLLPSGEVPTENLSPLGKLVEAEHARKMDEMGEADRRDDQEEWERHYSKEIDMRFLAYIVEAAIKHGLTLVVKRWVPPEPVACEVVPAAEPENQEKCAYCGNAAVYACADCEEPICEDHTKIIAFGVPMCLKCDAEAREYAKGLEVAKKAVAKRRRR